MNAPFRIFYNSLGTPTMYEMIRECMGEGMELVTLDTDEDDERRRKIADCDAVIVAAKPITKQMIEAGEKLRLIHHQGVGYQDTVDIEAAHAAGLRLAITPAGTTIGVAEHALLLALGAARRAAYADAELRKGHWLVNALRPVSVELSGKTVGFVGFGRIGQEAAVRFSAFGTKNVYFDPAHPKTDPRTQAVPKSFDWIVENVDLVSLHLPLTEDSRHIVSRDVIARMKRGAILVNTARGGLVDDKALAQALSSGKLLAAGLDVFENEPISADHPLCGLPNVFLTPHISAGTRDAMRQKMVSLFQNIDRFRCGDSLENEIDLSFGR